jgi:hypothetical protein
VGREGSRHERGFTSLPDHSNSPGGAVSAVRPRKRTLSDAW